MDKDTCKLVTIRFNQEGGHGQKNTKSLVVELAFDHSLGTRLKPEQL